MNFWAIESVRRLMILTLTQFSAVKIIDKFINCEDESMFHLRINEAETK